MNRRPSPSSPLLQFTPILLTYSSSSDLSYLLGDVVWIVLAEVVEGRFGVLLCGSFDGGHLVWIKHHHTKFASCHGEECVPGVHSPSLHVQQLVQLGPAEVVQLVVANDVDKVLAGTLTQH